MEEKTNVMRLIDKKKLPYKSYALGTEEAVSGVEAAAILGKDEDRVFKTLVCSSKSGANYVFVIPVAKELDLKKAAKSVGEKAVEMLKAKELLPLTGYVHGGCSPIGMKKYFKTVVDLSAQKWESICFSAGKIGYQVEMNVNDLGKMIRIELAELTD